MAHEPFRARRIPAKARAKSAGPVTCMAFVALMGAAFWIGTVWASQAWMAFSR